MLPHHAGVYQHLQAQFPEADVYISTSDKVEGTKSAFNFKEKVAIMTDMHGIPADKIIQAKSPYLVDSYKTQFDQENSMVIFAVGGKDADRFPMNNVDDTTGLDMTVRGEARPKYYQMINTLKAHPVLPMSQRGYVYNAPTIGDGDSVASASAFRDAFISAPDDGSRKEIFTKYMGEFNNNIYTLFVNKLMDKKMKTENAYKIDVIKYLSGMLNEAPIDFGDYDDEEEMDDADTDGLRPGFKQDSMVNQLGKISDSGEAAKDADQLMKKGKEFTVSSSVITDDGETFNLTPAEADALLQMFNMLSAQRAGEEESPREKFTRSIQASKGLESMLGFAKSKGLVKEEGKTLPQVDLGDIRDDYAIEEDDDYEKAYDFEPTPEAEAWYNSIVDHDDLDNMYNQWEEAFSQADTEDKVDVALHHVQGLLADGPLDDYNTLWQAWEQDEDIEDMLPKYQAMAKKSAGTPELPMMGEADAVEEGRVKDVLIDAQQMSKEEFDAKYNGEWNYDEILADYPVEQDESFDPAMEPNHADSEFERIYTAYENGGEPELAEYLGMSDRELDQEMTEYAMDHNLHMDDDRDDVIQGYIEQLIDNADHKDMGAQMAQYESQLVQLKKLAGI